MMRVTYLNFAFYIVTHKPQVQKTAEILLVFPVLSYLLDISRLFSSPSLTALLTLLCTVDVRRLTVVSLTDFPLLTTDSRPGRAGPAQACTTLAVHLYTCTPVHT